VESHLSTLPKLLAMKVVRHFSPFHPTSNRMVYWAFVMAWVATAPLLLFALVRHGARKRAELTILLLPCLSTLLTALIFYGSIRFRDADAPLFVVPAAAVVAAALAASLPRRWRERFAAVDAQRRT
jgi:hypothetical protein